MRVIKTSWLATPFVAALAASIFSVGATAQARLGAVKLEDIRSSATAACKTDKKYRIAFSHSASELAIVKQVREFANKRAKELGCVTVMHDNTQRQNLEQQINAVQGWVTLGVDAIVVLPIDPTALAPLQKRAQQKGIKWLTYLAPMKGSNGFVGFNHAQSGQLIAKAAVAWVKSKNLKNPKALVTTLTPLPAISPRWTEVERIFAQNGIAVVAKQDAVDQTNGLKVTETVLKRHPDLAVVIGMADDAAVGAYRAVKAARLDQSKIFIGGQDGSLEALTAIKERGAFRATSAILINELGANIVDLALNAVTGKGPSAAFTPTVLASQQDLALVEKLLKNHE